MAKRKRLTPLPRTETDRPDLAPSEVGSAAGAMPLGAPPASRAPIAGIAGDAALNAAAAELAETLSRARAEGRLVTDLPLDAVDVGYLVRDRIAADDAEMAALVESLRARGQQTPIEVAPLPRGRFGLISGWRRLGALRRLLEETGEERFLTVQALIRPPKEAAEAYLSMVEENEIRVGLSYYERARIALRTVDQGVHDSPATALRALFHAASRPKRSKIGSFLVLVRELDGALRFPAAIGERLGLRLSQALEHDPRLAARIRRVLEDGDFADPAAEQRCLEAALAEGARPVPAPTPEEPCPGVRLDTAANGTLKLSGPGVDAELRQRLLAWLRGAEPKT
ncbi:ParB/RepB/Spo0J family partition protein [Oceaniglobus roseus]|uniref:ParB/RepB/Spo0J family partition protein n=1 Tax=Oceaniglobus roseus TaxID=1737570 RepID=UPI000C7F5674|nr:ParB N-terminal domain-containing protein [Kandeliimicrobium roseum]